MSKGKEFEMKFLRLFEEVTQVFRSGEISAAMGLRAQVSLESIIYKEKIINKLKEIALEHYSNNTFKESRMNIVMGLDIILAQIQHLKKQLSEANENIVDKKMNFDQEEFKKGFMLVENEIRGMLQKDS
ncbi:MAG: hypothetical protein ACP5NW_05430 [Candidatus Woesearchaeota archaeon]